MLSAFVRWAGAIPMGPAWREHAMKWRALAYGYRAQLMQEIENNKRLQDKIAALAEHDAAILRDDKARGK